MFTHEHSFLMRCLAVLALVVWSGAFHLDAWVGALGLGHPHAHHVVGVHSHSPHQDGHPHTGRHDHGRHDHGGHDHGGHDHGGHDPYPMPDTQAEPVASHVAKIALEGPRQLPKGNSWLPATLRLVLSNLSGAETEHPPPRGPEDTEPPELILLTHCVQANAPPVLS